MKFQNLKFKGNWEPLNGFTQLGDMVKSVF